jgi:hypothetical protein
LHGTGAAVIGELASLDDARDAGMPVLAKPVSAAVLRRPLGGSEMVAA